MDKKPAKLQEFMDMLMEEARRDSLKELLKNNGMSYAEDFTSIEGWFLKHGINL